MMKALIDDHSCHFWRAWCIFSWPLRIRHGERGAARSCFRASLGYKKVYTAFMMFRASISPRGRFRTFIGSAPVARLIINCGAPVLPEWPFISPANFGRHFPLGPVRTPARRARAVLRRRMRFGFFPWRLILYIAQQGRYWTAQRVIADRSAHFLFMMPPWFYRRRVFERKIVARASHKPSLFRRSVFLVLAAAFVRHRRHQYTLGMIL